MRQSRPAMMIRLGLLVLGSLGGTGLALAQGEALPPSRERQQALTHLVRQDCGSCHGLTLKGGLGPALTPDRLKDWAVADLAATILYGRPTTPMPPFLGILDHADATWIARQLQNGFPREP